MALVPGWTGGILRALCSLEERGIPPREGRLARDLEYSFPAPGPGGWCRSGHIAV